MRIPSLMEITIKIGGLKSQGDSFKTSDFGKLPLVLNLLDFDKKEELFIFLEELEELLKSRNLNPHFPYPIYIKTNLLDAHSFFPILKRNTLPPKFFFLKDKKLTSLEEPSLQKIDILSSRLLHTDITSGITEIKTTAKSRKLLAEVCRENNYYEKVLELLGETPL